MTMQGGRPLYAILATALTLQGWDGLGPSDQGCHVTTLSQNDARRSATVQRRGVKSRLQGRGRKTMLTIGWIAVLLVLAMQWADGGFPFSTKRLGMHHQP
jgi:hypothetical protein